MSFGTYARRVRNRDLPYGQRHTSLRCAVARYMPLGFNATWDYITGRAGRVRTDEAALLTALDVLETSRAAWLAELAAFAQRRAAEKRDRRTISTDEHRYQHGWRWPGPDAHEAMFQTIASLWREYELSAFPDVPAADKAELVMLDLTVAGCVSTYLHRGGSLLPGHRDTLRQCLAELRAVRLDYPLPYAETYAHFRRLLKMAELIAHDALPLVRRAWRGDADRIAEISLAARAEMAYPPRPHTGQEARAWIGDRMLPAHDVWVAELRGRVAGFAAVTGHVLAHLYVAPEAQRHGLGSALLAQVKKARPDHLDLHVFQQNTGARRFYENHGFALITLGDGADNEEKPPDARYRWRAADDPPRPEPADGLNDSLTCAFPFALADDVQAATRIMPPAAHPPTRSFEVVVEDERVTVPERIFHPEPDPDAFAALSPVQQAILHCLYTRHHDGFVRQRHLARIVGLLEPWILPYVVRLAGEHIVEIVADVQHALHDVERPGSAAHTAYGRFLAANPDFADVTTQRVISYWNRYHMDDHPRLADYPGHRLMTALRSAAASRL